MNTTRTLGGWLIAAVCLPVLAVLLYQQYTRGSQTSAAPPPATVTPNPNQALASQTGPRPVTAHSQAGPTPEWFNGLPAGKRASTHLRATRTVVLQVQMPSEIKDVTQDEVETKLTYKLRQAGLKVGTFTQPPADREFVALAAFVSVMPIDELPVHTYRVSLMAFLPAVTLRDGVFTKGLTPVWSETDSGWAGSLRVKEACMSNIEKQAEKFANAVAEANGG